MAPVPAEGPSNVDRAAGSSFAQGDQSSQLWKLWTRGNTAEGGASIVIDLVTRNSGGLEATTPTNTTTTAATAMRAFFSVRNRRFAGAVASTAPVPVFSAFPTAMALLLRFDEGQK